MAAKGSKEKSAAPVGVDEVHEVIAERREHQEEKAKAAAAAEKAKAAAVAATVRSQADPSCNVDAPRLSATGHQKELAGLRKNLAQRQLAELARKFPVVAALVKENTALKAKASK